MKTILALLLALLPLTASAEEHVRWCDYNGTNYQVIYFVIVEKPEANRFGHDHDHFIASVRVVETKSGKQIGETGRVLFSTNECVINERSKMVGRALPRRFVPALISEPRK